MNRAWSALIVTFCVALGSCAYPGPYDGYQSASYTVRGQHYEPMSVEEALYHEDTGVCSWYDESSFFGLKRGTTSLGEKVMPWHLIAAHKTLPLPAVIKATNLENGRSVKLRVNDRGPFIDGRVLDVSPRAAKRLGFRDQGLTEVHFEVLSVGDGKWKRTPRRKWFFGLF